RYGPRPRPAAPPRLTRRSPPAPLTPTSPEGYGELLAGRQGQGERVVRSGDAPLQEAGREGRHPHGAAASRGLRQAERAQEEEGGGRAQASPEEASQDGALTSPDPRRRTGGRRRRGTDSRGDDRGDPQSDRHRRPRGPLRVAAPGGPQHQGPVPPAVR